LPALLEIRPKEGIFTALSLVKELGRRTPKVYAAHATRGTSEPELVVVERYPKTLGEAVLATLEEDARALGTLRHPNLGGVLGTLRHEGELFVVSQWVEGELLAELRKDRQKPLPLDVGLRVVVDVLGALSALHAVREAPPLLYGAITPGDVVVGLDGVGRLVRPWLGRAKPGLLDPDRPTSMAPELLRDGGERTVRADVFTGGVLLWETLTGWRLFARSSAEAQLARLSQGRVPRANVPKDAPWAAALADVAERALAIEPGARYATIAEMAAAIRLVVRSKLASPDRVASHVTKLAGDRVLARRSMLEPLVEAPASRSRPSLSADAVKALGEIRPSERPPPVAPVAPAPAPAAKPAPPKPAKPPVPSTVAASGPPSGEELLEPSAPSREDVPVAVEEVPVAAQPTPSPPVERGAPPEAPTTTAAPIVAREAPPSSPELAADAPGGGSGVEAAELDVLPVEKKRKSRGVVWFVIAACLALLAAAAVRAVALRDDGGDAKRAAAPSTTAHPSPVAPAPASAPVATSTDTTPPIAPPASAATSEPLSEPPAPSSAASPSTAASPAPSPGPRPFARPNPRPRPTYDPEGI
jgi:serine/threonine-protein kinase